MVTLKSETNCGGISLFLEKIIIFANNTGNMKPKNIPIKFPNMFLNSKIKYLAFILFTHFQRR